MADLTHGSFATPSYIIFRRFACIAKWLFSFSVNFLFFVFFHCRVIIYFVVMARLSVWNGLKLFFSIGFIFGNVKLFKQHVFGFLNILRFVNQLINFINNLWISSQNYTARNITTDCTATRIGTFVTGHRIDGALGITSFEPQVCIWQCFIFLKRRKRFFSVLEYTLKIFLYNNTVNNTHVLLRITNR